MASAPATGTTEEERALEPAGSNTPGERNIWYAVLSASLAGSAVLVCCCIYTFLYYHRIPPQGEIIVVSVGNENDSEGSDDTDARNLAGQ